jgi:hypothetical protein
MKCEQFKNAYQKFDGADNVIHWKDWETPEYGAYSDHMQDCPTCRDWFQTQQLEAWKVDVSKFPCMHMAYHANYKCSAHQNPWECPSALVAYLDQFDEYGIPIRDGTESYWKIDNCPWCGTQLPESRRDMWIMKLRALGFDPFNEYEKIPAEYKTGRWYRDGHNPRLRLV